MITGKSRTELYLDKLIKNLNYYRFEKIGDMVVSNNPNRRFKTFLLPNPKILLFLSTMEKELIDERIYFECYDEMRTCFLCFYRNIILALEHCIIRKRFNINNNWGAFPSLRFRTRRFGEPLSSSGITCDEWLNNLYEPYQQQFKEIHTLHLLFMHSNKKELESKYNTVCDPYVNCLDVN